MANTLLVSGSTNLTTKHPVAVQSLQWRRNNFSNLSFNHSLNLNPIKPSLRWSAKPKSGSGNPNGFFEGVEAILNTLIEEPEKVVKEVVDKFVKPDPDSDSSWPVFDEFSSSCSKVRSDPNLSDKLSLDELLALLASAAVLGTIADLTCKPIQVDSSKGKKMSVLKLQVGLLGMVKLLQREINRIAESADTSTSEGQSYLLTETIVALLRHPDYCILAHSSTDIKTNSEETEKLFNKLSIEERVKFDEETLLNVNNIRGQRQYCGSLLSNHYAVITILVAAQGDHTLPRIRGSKELKDALLMLGSIPTSQIRAVEVLWTPQAENDTLPRRKLLQDYPLLQRLHG